MMKKAIWILIMFAMATIAAANPDVVEVSEDYIKIKMSDAASEVNTKLNTAQDTIQNVRDPAETKTDDTKDNEKKSDEAVKDDSDKQNEQKEIKLTKQQILETGYAGSLNSYAKALDKQVTDLRMDVRNKIFSEGIASEGIAQDVLKGVSDRENAKTNIEAAKKLKMEKTEIIDEIQSIFYNEIEPSEIGIFEKEVNQMDSQFVKKLYLTASEGDEKQKTAVKKQIKELSTAIKQNKKFKVNYNEDQVRALLDANASADDIANSIIT